MTRDISVLEGILEQIFPGVVFGKTRPAKPQYQNELCPRQTRRALGWSNRRKKMRGISNGPD